MTDRIAYAELAPQARSGRLAVPDHWKQGRTAYGGLTAAAMLERAQATMRDLPPLRSALINFTGPVSSVAELSAEGLRQGRNVTTVRAAAVDGGRAVGAGVFSFGAARDSSVRLDRPAPDAPAPADCPPFMPPQFERFAPAFFGNFECRLIEGDRPVSGSDRGYIRAWARHADPGSRAGEGALLCLADILPPAAMPMLKAPGPVSSMSWMVNLLRAPDTRDGWFMVESSLSAAGGGYSSQVMRMWNTDRQLVVEGMQSIVIFA